MIGQNNTQKENRHNANNDYWYRQRIVDKIHEMHSKNNTQNLWLPKVMDNLNFDLVKSTIIQFGSWENALKNAGIYNSSTNIPSSLGKDHWSDEKIIEQIRALHSFRFDLSAKFIKIIYPELYYAAKNKSAYGSWCNALSEAEVDLRSIRAVASYFWTFSKIYSALHDYDLAYGNVQSSFIRKLNPSLYSASRKYFKSWSKTITMAGFKPERAFLKVLLEPLRIHLLQEYVKKVFELLGIKHKIHISSESDYTTTGNINDIPELHELQETIRLPTYYIETTDFEDGSFLYLINDSDPELSQLGVWGKCRR